MLIHGGPGAYDYLGESAVGTWLCDAYLVAGYDQRGCRRSPSAGPFTVDASLADLEAIRRHLGVETFTLVGHSWGGLLAMFYAAAFGRHVDGLVLVGSAGPRSGWEHAFQGTMAGRHTPEQRRLLAQIDRRIAGTRDRAERGELYRQRFNAALPSYMAPQHRGVAPQIEWFNRQVNVKLMADGQTRRYANRTWEQGLAELVAPVTVIHGRQDPMPWSVVDDIQQLLPRATVVGLDDCGHFPWLEVPERFRRVLLDAVSGRLG